VIVPFNNKTINFITEELDKILENFKNLLNENLKFFDNINKNFWSVYFRNNEDKFYIGSLLLRIKEFSTLNIKEIFSSNSDIIFDTLKDILNEISYINITAVEQALEDPEVKQREASFRTFISELNAGLNKFKELIDNTLKNLQSFEKIPIGKDGKSNIGNSLNKIENLLSRIPIKEIIEEDSY